MKLLLSSQEKLALTPRLHWFILVPSLAALGVGAAILPVEQFRALLQWTQTYGLSALSNNIVTVARDNWQVVAGLVILVLGFLAFIRALVRFLTVKVWITTHRIVKKGGLLSIFTAEITLDRVESVDIVQSFLGNVFNYGHLLINSTLLETLILPTLKDPAAVRQKILELIGSPR